MENRDISRIFANLADVLELKGEDAFRVRAYKQAAQAIEGHPARLAELDWSHWKELPKIPGVGPSIAEKIGEIVRTGTLAKYEELKRDTPEAEIELLNIEGLGPKKVRRLAEDLEIGTIDELEKACRMGRVAGLPGMGPKTQEKILAGLAHYRRSEGRLKLLDASHIADSLGEYLRRSSAVRRIEVAGSYRRGRETVGDLDILAVASDPGKAAEHFLAYPDTGRVLSRGESRCSLELRSGLHVDLRLIEEEAFGAALLYFTGSKAHNIKLRTLAKKKQWKISEYGLFGRGGRRLAGKTEEDMYARLGMQWVPPELREDTGEIEAAAAGRLPDLVELKDMRGDLHSHTTATDGKSTIEEMIGAAKSRGYAYVAITDHTRSTRVAGGLGPKEMLRHLERIRRAAAKVRGMRVLTGAEVDILEDGSLDLPDEVLGEMDMVLVSVHSHFSLPPEKMTDRLLRALDNPHVNVLAHPTGRLIGTRRPYEMDLERLFLAAIERKVALEVNCHQNRLDLPDAHIRMARDLGARFVIDTDAHHANQFDNMRLGVATARRGWLEKRHVLNTLGAEALLKALRR